MVVAGLSEGDGLRTKIEEITARKCPRLRPAARAELVNDLINAVGFARAGLADILAGKHTKPMAWTLDIFVRDVCAALRGAGVPVSMNPRARGADAPKGSAAQQVAAAIGRAAGLPGIGELFKQMQRAKNIHKIALAGSPRTDAPFSGDRD